MITLQFASLLQQQIDRLKLSAAPPKHNNLSSLLVSCLLSSRFLLDSGLGGSWLPVVPPVPATHQPRSPLEFLSFDMDTLRTAGIDIDQFSKFLTLSDYFRVIRNNKFES